MSVFNPFRTCVFSEVRARLTMNGEPIKNTKVTRQWEWNKRRSDSAITDDDGYVYFPAVFEFSLARLLPIEVVIGQRLSIEANGEEIKFWQNSKRAPDKNAEYGGHAFNVSCELTQEEVLMRDYGSLMLTMCKLD